MIQSAFQRNLKRLDFLTSLDDVFCLFTKRRQFLDLQELNELMGRAMALKVDSADPRFIDLIQDQIFKVKNQSDEFLENKKNSAAHYLETSTFTFSRFLEKNRKQKEET